MDTELFGIRQTVEIIKQAYLMMREEETA